MKNFKQYQNKAKQAGLSTLTIVLVLLVVLMLPIMTSLRRTQTNEQILSSTMDRARVFQAAESALVEGEAFAATKPATPSSGCASGICAIPDGAAPWEGDEDFWDGSIPNIAVLPDGIETKYIVEFLGLSTGESDDCTTGGDVSPDAKCDQETSRYRVTALSRSVTGAEVMLQSNFLAP